LVVGGESWGLFCRDFMVVVEVHGRHIMEVHGSGFMVVSLGLVWWGCFGCWWWKLEAVLWRFHGGCGGAWETYEARTRQLMAASPPPTRCRHGHATEACTTSRWTQLLGPDTALLPNTHQGYDSGMEKRRRLKDAP